MAKTEPTTQKCVLPRLPANKEPTVIFSGNSIANQGIYSDLIEERLTQKGSKVNVVNLATKGSSTQEKLHLIDMAIGAQAGPRFVVYQVSPAEFENELVLCF